jgi:hypothetical protein
MEPPAERWMQRERERRVTESCERQRVRDEMEAESESTAESFVFV